MRLLVYRSLLLVSVFVISSSATLIETVVRWQSFTKSINKEFSIAEDGLTTLSNKYGKINIETWDKDKVKIEVEIIVRASSESKAEEAFDRISIDFNNTATMVSAETQIASNSKSWGSKNYDFEINYNVVLPDNNELDIDNKYGDVAISDMDGKVDLNLKYGNFLIEAVGEESVIYLGYGNGRLGKSSSLDVELAYSKLDVKNTGTFEIESKYSQVKVEEAESIISFSKYDTYRLGTIQSLKNQGKYDNFEIDYLRDLTILSKYTEIEVNQVADKLDLDLQHGGARVALGSDFESVDLVGSYANFQIIVNDETPFKLDALGTYAGIRYPDNMNVVYDMEKGSRHEVQAYLGAEDDKRVLKARLSYGGLKVLTD